MLPRLCLFLACTAFLLGAQSLSAQQQGGGGNNQNQNNNAGITIDARGIVAPGFTADQSHRLDRKRQQAAAAKLIPGDVNQRSDCRKVSLVQLEAEVQRALDAKEPLSVELQNLAGLQRIDYLFVDPEGRDLILAGPADGFAPDAAGRMRGVDTGRPTLKLDDLIVALRTVPQASEIGCSIDPAPARLAALQDYVAHNSSAATTQVIEGRYKRMAEILGLHDAKIYGVPDDSHFGRVLIEADYRMKRISLGLENPGVKGLRSHLSMLGAGGNSIQRWWFVPLYDGLYRSEDHLAFEFVGPRAQLLSQEEVTTATGDRFAAATTRLTTQAFAKQFTERFADLAEQSPVFAELQNLIDLCLVSALIDHERLAEKAGWTMGAFRDPEKLPHASGPVPKQVPAMVNYRRASAGMVVGLVSGGVTIRPKQVARPAALKVDPARRLDSIRAEHVAPQRPAARRWWWD